MSTKILAVDDSKTIRTIVAKTFKPFDCVVLEAENGLAGLAVACREKPDVILLDYTMPVMDGFEVLARLRSDPDLKMTPVIMLTAEAGRATVTKIAKLGVRDYLIKPFKSELLVERVGRVVDLKSKTDVARHKRFDDPINILVVDDKPAILDQIRAGLADTPWKISSVTHPGQALDSCMSNGVEVVLASLSLPNDGAFMLFQSLRGFASTTSIPILGMCVRTAAAEQTRAQETGFASIVTKPINTDELKDKICRVLKLETSYKYLQQRDNTLVLTLPKDLHPRIESEVISDLANQLTALVDAGGNTMIVDFTAVAAVTLPLIKLVISAIHESARFSIRQAMVASDEIQKQCRIFEESKDWLFGATFEEALARLK
jgi:two-component system cell cycle response regulator